MNLRSLFFAAGFAFALSITPVQAAFHLFRIAEVYSNADGSVQYVVIRESKKYPKGTVRRKAPVPSGKAAKAAAKPAAAAAKPAAAAAKPAAAPAKK